ncbi:HAD domain-containing protein, partial [Escherichia coli]|uniref:HAD domain-containing protein n=1 Tax=Escherichia coli TaxID=562 RepID=UPI00339BE7FC
MRERLRDAGFRGEFHRRWRTGEYGKCRGDEIQVWLDLERPVKYVILDDDRGTLPSQKARHVRPRAESGLF